MIRELKKRFGKSIYTTRNEVTLEDKFISLLEKYGLTVTTAESCSGGLLSGRLINVAGASDVINRSFVTMPMRPSKTFLG